MVAERKRICVSEFDEIVQPTRTSCSRRGAAEYIPYMYRVNHILQTKESKKFLDKGYVTDTTYNSANCKRTK